MGGALGHEEWRVECASGWTYAERPTALVRDGQRFEIERISNMWRGPQGVHFITQIQDQGSFHLLYNEAEDRWTVEQV